MFVLTSLSNVLAQSDEENCKDYPLFSRMPNFYIVSCTESFNEFEMTVGLNKTTVVAGTVYTYNYIAKENVTKFPSALQIIKN